MNLFSTTFQGKMEGHALSWPKQQSAGNREDGTEPFENLKAPREIEGRVPPVPWCGVMRASGARDEACDKVIARSLGLAEGTRQSQKLPR
jgi:hypothetical protein